MKRKRSMVMNTAAAVSVLFALAGCGGMNGNGSAGGGEYSSSRADTARDEDDRAVNPADPSGPMAGTEDETSRESNAALVIDLNTAPKGELVRLPGVTDEVATKIVEARPFRDEQELVSKRVITQDEFNRIRANVTVDASAENHSERGGNVAQRAGERVGNAAERAGERVGEAAERTGDAVRRTGERAGRATRKAALVVDINKATKDELVRLPGVTDATAQKIIQNRPYENEEELVTKGFITRDEYNQIRWRITATHDDRRGDRAGNMGERDERGTADDRTGSDARGNAERREGRNAALVVDINKATEDELVRLPGITEEDARKIVQNRPYENEEELVSKGFITREEYNQIRWRITATHEGRSDNGERAGERVGKAAERAGEAVGKAAEKTGEAADQAGDAVRGTGKAVKNAAMIIDINKAKADELTSLPGIDEETAQKIIQNRPYENEEELVSRGFITRDEYNQIRWKITATDPDSK